MELSTLVMVLILLPLVASTLIYLISRICIRAGAGNPARWLGLAALLATGAALYLTGAQYLAGESGDLVVGAIALRFDGLALLLGVTVVGLGIVVTLFSGRYMRGEEGEEKFYALLTMMIGTIIGLGCAADLFNLWVWFEAMAIASYMLVAFYRQQGASLEAGVKYLVQSAVGSALVLLGIALVFSQTGELSLDAIRGAIFGRSPVLLAAGALFVIGFGVKTALVPMHTWLPDAHSQAPSGISAMLSGVVIEAGLVAMLRALGSLSPASAAWGNLLMFFGAINIVVGNVMALRQVQVKRLLAYSSLSHVGYMLIGLGVGLAYAMPNGAAGGFFHLLVHAMMKGLAFLAAGTLLYSLHISKGNHSPLVLEDLNGAARRYPLTAFAFALAVFSLGGLPPLAGFMSKWQIFVAAVETQNTGVILLVIFAALNSVLSLAYYAPLVNRLYRHAPSEIVVNGSKASGGMVLPLALMSAFLIILGFYPALASWLTEAAASSLFTAFGG